ncbi:MULTISPECIES: ATP-binding cassette domain-containing protein [Streptacidiphilus]|uniref:ATP-binding cassette domain-containing protein n=1 Tax=Streptacidiphilus cavernicola TaxID=3342716 RepID=A0ABV6UU56_9ACTN|nr:ATP-binding cassette domain-containing protein [Streptacidiphilus jeojiense]
MPAIEVRGVSKRFRSRGPLFRRRKEGPRETVALDRVDLEIGTGEFVGLLGQNGAGKSTLIRVMTGLMVPDAGEVRVLGLDPNRDQVRNARNIGVTFGQRTQLWWDLRARDSFEILRDMYGLPAATYTRRMRELDDFLGLSAFWDTQARHLSLGQRVRCDLAAAVLHRPVLLFLDEPTIGLDILVKDQVRAMLADLAGTGDHAIVLTTHDVADVEALCPRIVLIDRGRTLFDGTLADLTGIGGGRRTVVVELAGGRAAPEVRMPGVRLLELDGARATYALEPGVSQARFAARVLAADEVRAIDFEGVRLEDVLRSIYAGDHSALNAQRPAASPAASPAARPSAPTPP